MKEWRCRYKSFFLGGGVKRYREGHYRDIKFHWENLKERGHLKSLACMGDNIKIDLKWKEWKSVGGVEMAHDRDNCQAVVKIDSTKCD
jgi:hypothetical protein